MAAAMTVGVGVGVEMCGFCGPEGFTWWQLANRCADDWYWKWRSAVDTAVVFVLLPLMSPISGIGGGDSEDVNAVFN